MAKCVKKGDKVVRVSNNKALELLDKGWEYCPKSEYKRQEAQNEAKSSKKISRKK